MSSTDLKGVFQSTTAPSGPQRPLWGQRRGAEVATHSRDPVAARPLLLPPHSVPWTLLECFP